MIAAIADTHTIIWYVFMDPRLSKRGLAYIETTAENDQQIGVSSITLVEMVYLIEKGRIPSETLSRVARALDTPDSVLTEIILDREIARTMSRIAPSAIPDMPDRIIAATAVHRNVPLISRDGKIRVSGIETIW
jgi:PIN domain nuclease of toxin-antitoxin system